jgi:hypothetical protein
MPILPLCVHIHAIEQECPKSQSTQKPMHRVYRCVDGKEAIVQRMDM